MTIVSLQQHRDAKAEKAAKEAKKANAIRRNYRAAKTKKLHEWGYVTVDAEQVAGLCKAAADKLDINDTEMGFLIEMHGRAMRYGSPLGVTERQFEWLQSFAVRLQQHRQEMAAWAKSLMPKVKAMTKGER